MNFSDRTKKMIEGFERVIELPQNVNKKYEIYENRLQKQNIMIWILKL